MEGQKLIFSFCNDLSFVFDFSELAAAGSLIKFGAGFEEATLNMSKVTFATAEPQDLLNKKPALEFTLRTRATLPPFEAKEAVVTPEPSVVFRTTSLKETPVEKKQKIATKESEFKVPLTFPSKFEVGSSSKLPLTKTQRRNKNRRTRRKMDRERVIADLEVMKTVRAHERFTLPKVMKTVRFAFL